MDYIRIKDLEVYAKHGVLPEENVLGQKFLVSCELELDIRTAGKTDSLEESVNYSTIAHLIYELMQNETHLLLETCAERIAEEILLLDDKIQGVSIEIKKPWAPVGLPLDTVSVSLTRKWHEAYVATGSNLGDSRELIENAIKTLNSYKDIRVEKSSSLIETEPYGVLDQPSFLNGAVKLYTLQTPYELLDTLHDIEHAAGRERKIHWGPRTLDLDILFYDDMVLEDETLCIPHVDMKNRDFVLKPMAELAPYKVHPLYHKRMIEMLRELEERV